MSALNNIVIDRRSSKDYSLQIYEKIKKTILLHQFSEEILNYEKLSKKLNVDKSVVIKAFDYLVDEGIFTKCEKGKYCNVYREVITYNEHYESSLIKHIKNQNLELSVDLLESKDVIIDEESASILNFEVGQQITYQTRVYYGDNYPKAYVKIYFDERYRGKFDDLNKELLDSLEFFKKNLKIKRILKSVTFSNKINQYLNQPNKTAGIKLLEYVYDNEKLHYLAVFYFTAFFTITSNQ